ncbi:MAG: hypothetical protein J0H40_05810 [Rhizobiales bacterium]|nr:hypothetical protein [Hyphomicrobiales bacterium]
MKHTQINIFRSGLIIGLLLAGWHFIWAVLVASGWGQTTADFIFWIHFIKPVYVVEPFIATKAAALILLTAALGFLVGVVGAWIWNASRRD